MSSIYHWNRQNCWVAECFQSKKKEKNGFAFEIAGILCTAGRGKITSVRGDQFQGYFWVKKMGSIKQEISRLVRAPNFGCRIVKLPYHRILSTKYSLSVGLGQVRLWYRGLEQAEQPWHLKTLYLSSPLKIGPVPHVLYGMDNSIPVQIQILKSFSICISIKNLIESLVSHSSFARCLTLVKSVIYKI